MKSILLRITSLSFLIALFIPNPAQSASEQRLALVIGNGNYAATRLKNPVNDANDIASTLKKLGFSVILKKDVNLRGMEDAISDFGNRLKRGGVGLFYYAGHGLQVNGTNYLIPIGARIEKESDVKYETVDAGRILDEMANASNGLNIVILDACRDNPYSRGFRSATRGLAIVSTAPSGTFISYSTSPGQVARDGAGRNSPYTKALLENITKPGLPLGKVFMNVRSRIKKETGQIPWELSSLEGDFYFVPEKASPVSEGVTIVPAKPAETGTPSVNLDEEKAKIEAEWEKLRREKELLRQKEALEREQKEREEQQNKLAQ